MRTELRLASLLVPELASIRDAMAAIDAGGCEIALVVADDTTLVGTVTDGDVRRALLAGQHVGDPVAPHVHRTPETVTPATGRAEVLDLMRARAISQVPIVDEAGHVVGLHLMRELLGALDRPNWAVIMAGGVGARLRPLTEEIPKPMLPVAGRPILERLVLHLVGFGVRQVFLAVNHLAEVIEAHFGSGEQLGCRIDYLREDTGRPLGTAGALRVLVRDHGQPPDPLLVVNGDLVTQFDLAALLDHHGAAGAELTLAVGQYAHEVPFGVLATDGDRVTRLDEKPTATWIINTGIYVLEPTLLDLVPEAEFPMTALVEECLAAGRVVAAWPLSGEWHDVGRRRDLLLARGEL